MALAPATDPRETHLHPRHVSRLVGHKSAEARLLDAFYSGRFHHAWLLSGRAGIGKATLAWQLARFLMTNPDPKAAGHAHSLAVPDDHPAVRRILAGAHPDLHVLERRFDPKLNRLKQDISVDDVRGLVSAFGYTAGAGGWRVAIIDTGDDMNRESANALLKTLEEPPEKSVFLLVSHQPSALLPTLRSRTLALPLLPLSLAETLEVITPLRPDMTAPDLDAAARLSGGSPGRALQLAGSEGAAAFHRFEVLARPGQSHFTPANKLALASSIGGRAQAEGFLLFGELLLSWIASHAREPTATPARAKALANAHSAIAQGWRTTEALNLDRRLCVLDALQTVEDALKAP